MARQRICMKGQPEKDKVPEMARGQPMAFSLEQGKKLPGKWW